MKRLFAAFSLVVGFIAASAALADDASPAKQKAVSSIDRQASEMAQLSDQIWAFAETALRETRSAAVLADYAEAQGFEVERGVAEMPTAFVATYGKGRPVIGIMGEYDALPGISQKAVPYQEPLEEGAGGHGCGHNLFGPASLAAAVAIKERIAAGDLEGTVRFYGTPAEEDVGGKVYMIRAGLFDDVDVALAWHPGDEIGADTESSQAIVEFAVEFRGETAHAAFDPWNGRSALDGVEIFTHAINLMREHVKPTVRIHYVITDGGDVPNVVPDYARLWCWVRDSKRASLDELVVRARAIAEGAALATGTESTFIAQGSTYEILANMAGARIIHDNLMWLGPLEFTEAEQEFAREIQRAAGGRPRQRGRRGTPGPWWLRAACPSGTRAWSTRPRRWRPRWWISTRIPSSWRPSSRSSRRRRRTSLSSSAFRTDRRRFRRIERDGRGRSRRAKRRISRLLGVVADPPRVLCRTVELREGSRGAIRRRRRALSEW
jgi:aminobenzoyl-glutamate utilization protein B